MFDSVLPAESEPISVVGSRWLWAARFFALIYAVSLAGEYVAVAHFEPLDSVIGFLFTFGLRSLLSVVLLSLLFRSGKKSLAFALGLGAATAFIALFGVAADALFSLRSHYPAVCRYDASTQPTACHGGVVAVLVLRYLCGDARGKQRRHIQENGARSKGDGGTAIRLSRRNMLPTCRLADIHGAYLYLACRWRGHPHLRIALNISPR